MTNLLIKSEASNYLKGLEIGATVTVVNRKNEEKATATVVEGEAVQIEGKKNKTTFETIRRNYAVEVEAQQELPLEDGEKEMTQEAVVETIETDDSEVNVELPEQIEELEHSYVLTLPDGGKMEFNTLERAMNMYQRNVEEGNYEDFAKQAEEAPAEEVKEEAPAKKLPEVTELEAKVFNWLDEALSPYEENFSDVTVEDIAKSLELEVNQVKGIVGSLTKKDYVFTYNTDSEDMATGEKIDYDLICRPEEVRDVVLVPSKKAKLAKAPKAKRSLKEIGEDARAVTDKFMVKGVIENMTKVMYEAGLTKSNKVTTKNVVRVATGEKNSVITPGVNKNELFVTLHIKGDKAEINKKFDAIMKDYAKVVSYLGAEVETKNKDNEKRATLTVKKEGFDLDWQLEQTKKFKEIFADYLA